MVGRVFGAHRHILVNKRAAVEPALLMRRAEGEIGTEANLLESLEDVWLQITTPPFTLGS